MRGTKEEMYKIKNGIEKNFALMTKAAFQPSGMMRKWLVAYKVVFF